MSRRRHGFDGAMDDRAAKDAFNKVLIFLDKHIKNRQA